MDFFPHQIPPFPYTTPQTLSALIPGDDLLPVPLFPDKPSDTLYFSKQGSSPPKTYRTAANTSMQMLSQTVEKDDGYTVHVLPQGIQIQRLFLGKKKYNNVPAKGRLVQSWPVYNCCLIKQNELPVLLCLRSHRLTRELHLRRKSSPANLCQSKYS